MPLFSVAPAGIAAVDEAQKVAVGVELLHPLAHELDDDHGAGWRDGDAARSLKLSLARARCAPHIEDLTVAIEHENAIAGEVGNQHAAIGARRDPNGSCPVGKGPDAGYVPLAVEDHQARIAAVGHQHAILGVDGDRHGMVQRRRGGAATIPLGLELEAAHLYLFAGATEREHTAPRNGDEDRQRNCPFRHCGSPIPSR